MPRDRTYLEAQEDARQGAAELAAAVPAGFVVLTDQRSGVRLVRRGDEWFAIYRVEQPLGTVHIASGGEARG